MTDEKTKKDRDSLSLDELIKKADEITGITHIEKLIRLSQTRNVNYFDQQGLTCAGCHQEKKPETIIMFDYDVSDQVNLDHDKEYPINLKTQIKRWNFAFWICNDCARIHAKTPFEIRIMCIDFYLRKVTGKGLFDSHSRVLS